MIALVVFLIVVVLVCGQGWFTPPPTMTEIHHTDDMHMCHDSCKDMKVSYIRDEGPNSTGKKQLCSCNHTDPQSKECATPCDLYTYLDAGQQVVQDQAYCKGCDDGDIAGPWEHK